MGKIITITGNEGKTVFSYFLASKLSDKSKRTIIVSSENNAPNATYLIPHDEKADLKSLGKLLSLAVIKDAEILAHMQTFKNNSNLGIICYASGESKSTYPSITESNLSTFFTLLVSLVDYVIVDTQTHFNDIDKHSVQLADHKICITTADYKGFAFRQRYHSDDDTIHVMYNNCNANPIEDIKRTYKLNLKYILPCLGCLKYLYNGAYLQDINIPKKYEKLLDKIIKEGGLA